MYGTVTAFRLLSFLAFVIGTSALAAPGATPGEGSVSATGSARYSIPVDIPPGINGMQPNLALAYSSRSGDGYAGKGWDVVGTGISKIERCGQIFALDGQQGGVSLTSSDRFCLDGEPLVLVSGTYGGNGAVYAKAHDDLTEIVSYTSNSSLGPNWFKVKTPDGLIHQYGNSAESRTELYGSNVHFSWGVNRITDPNGNYINITYLEYASKGISYPREIQYTGTASSAPIYTVLFRIQNKPTDDRQVRYFGGARQEHFKRIWEIELQHNGTEFRRYSLNYHGETASPSRKSLLKNVIQCAGSDCLPATSVDWHLLEEGLQTGTNNSVNAGWSGSRLMDVDGDGRKDIVYPNGNWRVRLSTSGPGAVPTFASEINTYRSVVNEDWTIQMDYNGDGRADLLYPDNGSWYVLLSTGDGFAAPAIVTFSGSSSSGGNAFWSGDLNGDGRDDLVYASETIETVHMNRCAPGEPCYYNTGYTEVFYRLNTGSGFGSEVFAHKVDGRVLADDPFPSHYRYSSTLSLPDFNGDGISDVMILLAPVPQPDCINCGDDPSEWQWKPLIAGLGTNGFSEISTVDILPPDVTPLVIDINGDGNSDLAYPDKWDNIWKLHISDGNSLGAAIDTTLPRNAYVEKAVAIDYNDDGRQDIVIPDGGSWKVALSTGTGFQGLQATGANWLVDQFARVGDFDGDNDGDLLFLRPYSGNYYRQYVQNKGDFGNLVAKATDGLGNSVAFQYASSADPDVHTPYAVDADIGTNKTYLHMPFPIVETSTHSDGNGGLYQMDHDYERGRRDNKGWGFTGFNVHRTVDSRNGTERYQSFYTYFPMEMRPAADGRKDAANKWLHLTNFSWQTASPSVSAAKYIRMTSRRERNYFTAGNLTSDFTTTFSDFDSWQNPRDIVTQHSTTPSLYQTVTVDATYQNVTSGRRCLGLPDTRTVTVSRPGLPSISFASDTDWDTTKCRPTTSKSGSVGFAEWRSETYGYDNFGNVDLVTIDGHDVAARSQDIDYDPLGYRVIATENALNHRSTLNWSSDLRRLNSATDPNGLNTSYDYDNFGRANRITQSDGSYVDIALANCGTSMCGSNNYKLRLTREIKNPNTADLAGKQVSYLDSRGRVRRVENHLMTLINAGSNISVQTVDYDSLGQLSARSAPHGLGMTAHETTFQYDDYGRRTGVTMPDDYGNDITASISYSVSSGLPLITRTDPKLNVTKRLLNLYGEVQQATDANNTVTNFDYDALGRLIGVNSGGIDLVKTIEYDIFGYRTRLHDADLGDWNFDYNVLGQLKTQTDAMGQTMSMTYDVLGRPKTRTESEGTTTWTWDNASGAGIGKPASVSGPNATETYRYDALGRISSQDTVIDSITYRYDYAYDTFGRLDTLTYPTSVSTTQGSRFAVSYDYDPVGNLNTVSNANNGSEIFWQANEMDAFGRYANVGLGNGLSINKTFYAPTGRARRVEMNGGSNGTWSQLEYIYDANGNVTDRIDHAMGLSESFTYDNLDRLRHYYLGGTQKNGIGYGDQGNIAWKWGVGNYNYDDADKPHAVRSTTSGGVTTSYGYDDNGNMTSRGSTSINWSSYNKPTHISDGGDSLSFSYGPNRNRVKQVATIGGSTLVTHYAGLMEVVGYGSAKNYRHRIVAGGQVVAQHSRTTTGTVKTTYMASDSLGSINVLTDENGNLLERLHFDPWGKRIDGDDWDGNEQQADIDAIRDITHRGFTDHEMLDGVGMIHMNGRIYDPNLGRMLSADPVNSRPYNLQRYNRYSYVMNNPLRYVDPSGLDDCSPTSGGSAPGMMNAAVYCIAEDTGGAGSGGNSGGGGDGGGGSTGSSGCSGSGNISSLPCYQVTGGQRIPSSYIGMPAGGLGGNIGMLNDRVTPPPSPGLSSSSSNSEGEGSGEEPPAELDKVRVTGRQILDPDTIMCSAWQCEAVVMGFIGSHGLATFEGGSVYIFDGGTDLVHEFDYVLGGVGLGEGGAGFVEVGYFESRDATIDDFSGSGWSIGSGFALFTAGITTSAASNFSGGYSLITSVSPAANSGAMGLMAGFGIGYTQTTYIASYTVTNAPSSVQSVFCRNGC